jgi:phosphatidylserine/phosphatidylglycerophosphate/cardiolipin synthase-like enzyme
MIASIKPVLVIMVLLGLSGCAAKLPDPVTPCSQSEKEQEECAMPEVVLDTNVIEHQQSREWVPASKHSQDYLLLAMNKEIPIQNADIKIIPSDHKSAISSLTTKIWLIDNAKYSIDLTYYIFTKDLTGHAILGALCNAVKRGVDVRIMVDSVGSYSISHSALKALINCNADAGLRINPQGEVTTVRAKAQATIFNSLTRFSARINRRSHDKLLIIDGAYANDAWVLTGGRNISNDYYGFDNKLQDDFSVFKDMEILLKPEKNSQGRASVSQLAEYYFSILFSHKGNKPLTTWWAYNRQYKKSQASLKSLNEHPIFKQQYQLLDKQGVTELFPVKVRLAHEIGNLKSNTAVVSQYKKNKKANANSIMTVLKKVGEFSPKLTTIRIVSPYLFLQDELLKGKDGEDINLALNWLNEDPNRTLEIVTNSTLSSDNFFTQAVIDMNTAPRLLLPPEIEKQWLQNNLSKSELNPELVKSEKWQSLIANPRIKIYQLGKIDSIKLKGDKYYGKLHAKFLIADEISFVGTSNFDFRSMLFNSEVGYFIHGQEALKALNDEFDTLKAQSYLWGSPEWLALREEVRKSGGIKGFTTKSQREIYKTLKSTGLKIQL